MPTIGLNLSGVLGDRLVISELTLLLAIMTMFPNDAVYISILCSGLVPLPK